MGSLADLDRRLSRKLESGKAIQLTPADLDLLVLTGAYGKFREAVVEEQQEQCRLRSVRSRSINGGISGSTPALAEVTKSSGTMQSESASEALARAQAMLRPRVPSLTADTSKPRGARRSAQPAAKPASQAASS
jgi:hypothetical protein